MISTQTNVLPGLQLYLSAAAEEFSLIPAARKKELKELAAFVQQRTEAGKTAKLTFICTHNSRRSHISQIWAQVAAAYYGVHGVKTFSGGTEATAFNPRAVKAMQATGLDIRQLSEGNNPRYAVCYAPHTEPLEVWSKRFDDAANPEQDFAAIMTCSHADEHCPFIPGTTKRLPIRYNDPKEFDGTPEEHEKYSERVRQIAREMMYAFSLLKK